MAGYLIIIYLSKFHTFKNKIIMETEEKELTHQEAEDITGGSGIVDWLVDTVVDYLHSLAKPTA